MTRYTSIVVPHEVVSEGVTLQDLESFLKRSEYIAQDDTLQSVGLKFEPNEQVVIDEIEVQ